MSVSSRHLASVGELVRGELDRGLLLLIALGCHLVTICISLSLLRNDLMLAGVLCCRVLLRIFALHANALQMRICADDSALPASHFALLEYFLVPFVGVWLDLNLGMFDLLCGILVFVCTSLLVSCSLARVFFGAKLWVFQF